MQATEIKTAAKRKSKSPEISWMLAVFNLPLPHSRIAQFREAVLSCVADPVERETWCNEAIGRDGQTVFLSQYPLIQFRSYNGHAAIYALQNAVPLLEKFVQQFTDPRAKNHLPFYWIQHPFDLRVVEMNRESGFTLKTFSPKLRMLPVVYRLQTWLPLSKDNYAWWKTNRNLPDTEKTKKLQDILKSHLCLFISATGGYIPKEKFKLTILDKDRLKKVNFKDTGQVAFDIRYTVNLELPPFIGMGNHPAFGYGWQRLEME